MTDKFKLSSTWQNEVRATLAGSYVIEDNNALTTSSPINGDLTNYQNLIKRTVISGSLFNNESVGNSFS